MTADEEIRLGDRAAQLLQDEVLSLAMNNIEADMLKAWRDSRANDIEGREKIWQHLKQRDAVKAELERMVSAGKMAKALVEQENKRREFEREHGFRPPA